MELPGFVELKRNLKKDMSSFPEVTAAVIGDCATQHFSAALAGWGYTVGIRYDIFDSDYDQIDAQTMDPSSELYSHAPQNVIIVNCTQRLYEDFCAFPPERRSEFADTKAAAIESVWKRICDSVRTRIIQLDFPEWDDRVFGDYASRTPESFIYQLRRLNGLISDRAGEYKNLFITDICGIQSRIGEHALRDDKMYCVGKLPFRTDALPLIAKHVTDIILAASGRFKKCAVLDLDNTLWGGVIGDDGMDGIQIGELGTGHAFTEFQRWLKELKNRGIILCVCSKNNDSAAREPFLNHPDMVLRLEDISVFVANWQDKATNILSIRDTLNIGLDSMVFIDDNPFEREAVRSLVPGITVPDLPESPEDYVSFLRGEDLFGTASFSSEDRARTDQYRAEAERVGLRSRCADYGEYLRSLEMVAEAKPFDSFSFPRISQLTQRSNQFNLRTVRYSEQDIADLAADPGCITLYFKLRDRFGDHGLISVVVMKKRGKELFIDTWLMSCRVLKRGMEEFIVNKMIAVAREAGFERVIGEYVPTAKNSMVADIYPRLGFTPAGDNLYSADTASFTPNQTYITEEK